MYKARYSEEIIKKLSKLKKKDSNQYQIVRKKINSILKNPEHNYKFLHHDMKGINRIKIGHFVLVFIIKNSEEIVSFEDYNHHDNIY
tara:strand:+ start:498 stop:758 length:261 start_codon:yes stop_codon:yes gene_type:complete